MKVGKRTQYRIGSDAEDATFIMLAWCMSRLGITKMTADEILDEVNDEGKTVLVAHLDNGDYEAVLVDQGMADEIIARCQHNSEIDNPDQN